MEKSTVIKIKEEVISALDDFALIQQQLLDKFINQYSSSNNIGVYEQQPMNFLNSSSLLNVADLVKQDISPRDKFNLLEKPKTGSISVLGEIWKFQRHGAGILFQETKSKKVIDAHREIINHRKSFDGWRLAQYFESLNYSQIIWNFHEFAADDDDDLEKLLKILEQENILKLVSKKYKIYELIV